MHRPGQRNPGAAVPIKRVLRQGIYSICGVCRKAYGSLANAEACLARCLQAYVNATPVVAEDASGRRFRCHFCKRVYGSKDDAQKCATACKQQTQQKIEEQRAVASPAGSLPAARGAPTAHGGSAYGGGNGPSASGSQSSSGSAAASASASADNSTSGRRASQPTPAQQPEERRRKPAPPVRKDQLHKFLRDGRKLVCRKCGAEHQKLDDVIACYDSHPEKVASAPKAVEDKFFRDGAKYVCRACQKKYFTQSDVVACFDAHDGQVEAPAADAAPVAKTAPEVAPAAPVVPLSNDDDKFYRDGAKYVCRKCNAKYFTRGDVVACHDQH